ncbi:MULTISPECIES: DUF3040 domain-containing protein [unclassified Nocardioides]|uniref:DUF3040 domain-containing protein n=1 Tax=unclassified Nocardioides TaxID=2615069 RepID=UPI0006F340AC|nr:MULTISPECIES: DUF3040 domain-containing protein [unclassified Nocardioides]KQY63980.1 hypothetical protein ASD30_03105 [Nocardioides sp. Root140]KQZ69900.1 hypothetical protein ASD66_09350 [Nocardioides sp. Root151]KRF15993.1 hypothetical protein ASH02_05110 [Nocardioides sp. Soil796]
MPLSEEELRLLEQMERALVEEDPKFASTLRGTSFRRAARRRAILAGVVFAVGIAVLMSGAIFQMIPVGVLGFVIMLVSATYGLTTLRGRAAPASGEGDVKETRHGFGVVDGGRVHRPKARRGRSSAPFMERLEERWRHRRDNGGL